MYDASAVAANTVLRLAWGAASPLFTQYMVDSLGVGEAGSLNGGVGGATDVYIPFVFYKHGAAIRSWSKFAPTDEKPPPPADEEKTINGRSPDQASKEDKPVDEKAGAMSE